MNKTFNKIGFLTAGAGGNPTGIGDYVKALDAAGIPAVVMCNDGTVGLSDVFACWDAGSTVPHVVAFRVVKDGSEAYAVPNYNDTPAAAATAHWAKIKPHFPPQVMANKSSVWILPINEVDKNRADWLGHFAVALADIANGEGYRVAMFGWSSGEPEPEHWLEPGMVEYLKLCAQRPYQAAVCLHEYSYTVNNIFDQFPYKVGRFSFLFDACDSLGIKRPFVLIGEFGWQYQDIPSPAQALDDIDQTAAIYALHPEILGAATWYLGPYQGSSIDDQVNALIKPVTDYSLAASWEVTAPPPVTEPSTMNIEHIVKKSSEIGHLGLRDQVLTVRQRVWNKDKYGTGLGGFDILSAQKIVLDPAATNCAFVVEGVEDIEVTIEEEPEPEPEPTPPSGFYFAAWPTDYKVITQPFGANPDIYGEYDLPGHEGVDIRAPHGSNIYSVAAGEVYEVVHSEDGHNYGVRVRIRTGPYRHIYAHLDKALVSKGDIVTAGQKIGTADNTGNSFGSHLHLTLKHDDAATPLGAAYIGYPYAIVDPSPFLDAFNFTYADGVAPPPPTTGPLYDMVQYYDPGDYDYGPISIKTTSWGQGDIRQQLQRHDGYLFVTKGGEFEKRYLDTAKGLIHFVMDDSPGDGKYYTVTSPSGWIPAAWRVGDVFQRQETATYYWKDSCQTTGETSIWTNTMTFKAFYETWTSPHGIELANVSHLQWSVGGTVEEDYWLAPRLGYAGWKNKHGRESWIKELIPVGHQGNNKFAGGCYHEAFGE